MDEDPLLQQGAEVEDPSEVEDPLEVEDLQEAEVAEAEVEEGFPLLNRSHH